MVRDRDRPPPDAHADARLLLGATCVRVGFEDNVYLRRGQLAASNAASSSRSQRSLAASAARSRPCSRRASCSRFHSGGGRAMTYRISVDTGGTFTDSSSPTSGAARRSARRRPRRARLRGLARGHRPGRAERLGLDGRELLAQHRRVHLRHDARDQRDRRGQDRAHRVPHDRGLPGHPAVREGGKLDPFDCQIPYPRAVRAAPPDVRDPRAHRLRGRRLRRARRGRACWPRSRGRAQLGVEAVAVCLLWSIVNPAHELRVGELIARALPGVPSRSRTQLNPIIREYRRASSTAIDASLKPLMQEHLADRARSARGRASRASCCRDVVRRRAGDRTRSIERPIHSVGSGPVDGAGRRR